MASLFLRILEIEFAEEAWKINIESEHQLNSKPLAIDSVIKMVRSDEKIEKNIGRLFRDCNIIEYKSPDDYVSINDFYKVMGYGCIYQSQTSGMGEVDPDQITLMFVCYHYPKKLMDYLMTKDVKTECPEPGIYYLEGLIFPTEVILPPHLSADENIWLSRLRDNLETKDIILLLDIYMRNRKDPRYEEVTAFLAQINPEKVEEAKQMCLTLYEIFEDDFKQRELN